MKTRLLIYIWTIVALFLARASAAEITLVSEDRRATASAFVFAGEDFDDESYSEVATEGQPFDVALDAEAALEEATAAAAASQSSEISKTYIRADGSMNATAEVFVPGASAYGTGQSNVAIRFVVTEPTPFVLTGFIEGEGIGTMTVQLSRPFDTVAWYSATDERIELNQEGVLEADTYDINITSMATGSVSSPGDAQQGSGLYDVLFLLAESAGVGEPALAAVRAYPNPFRMSTRLEVPSGARELRILDAQGRLVRGLAASSPSVHFDGRDAVGAPLPKGVYWVKPVGADDAAAIKLVRLQ